MPPGDAPAPDSGTIERPRFLSAGWVAPRRDGRRLVGATRLIARQADTGEEQPWTPAAGQTPEVMWPRDEGTFAPVADPVEVADLDARAAFHASTYHR